MKTINKTFRIWYTTEFGIGFDTRKAKSSDSLRLPKYISDKIVEIEEIGE